MTTQNQHEQMHTGPGPDFSIPELPAGIVANQIEANLIAVEAKAHSDSTAAHATLKQELGRLEDARDADDTRPIVADPNAHVTIHATRAIDAAPEVANKLSQDLTKVPKTQISEHDLHGRMF